MMVNQRISLRFVDPLIVIKVTAFLNTPFSSIVDPWTGDLVFPVQLSTHGRLSVGERIQE